MCVRATVCPSVCCVFMRVRGHLRVCECVCPRACGHVRTCKCVSLQFCNANVYHFHSYHYCPIWHGYTVHNDMESMVLFFTISRRLVNVVTLRFLMPVQEIGDSLTCHILQ